MKLNLKNVSKTVVVLAAFTLLTYGTVDSESAYVATK